MLVAMNGKPIAFDEAPTRGRRFFYVWVSKVSPAGSMWQLRRRPFAELLSFRAPT
jgi:hypothetical protein